MREIVFRGKRVDNGMWVEGSAMVWNGLAQIIKHKFMLNSIWQTEKIRVIPSTIGQFTGLTDKNGVKIFEGDIVRRKYLYKDPPEEYCYYDIEFGKWCWSKREKRKGNLFSFDSIEAHEFEVIGNIHDKEEQK